MIQVPYPTGERNFIVPLESLALPESSDPERVNNHHHYWSYRRMGEFLISRTFRDMETHQSELPVDVHNWIHATYDQPAKLPSYEDMLDIIEYGAYSGERLKVQEGRRGPYFYQQISEIALKQCHQEYNRFNRKAS